MKKSSNQGASDVAHVMMGFTGGAHVPQVMQKPHLHQEIELNFLPAGTMIYLVGGRLVKVPSGRLVVFWATVPHQLMEVKDVPLFYWFTLPFAWMLQWQLPVGFTKSLLHGHFIIDQVKSDEDAALCQRWGHDLRGKHPDSQRIVLLEMEARLRRLIQRSPKATRSPGQRARGPVSAVQTMSEIMARHYVRPLSIAEIVKPTGLHPNYAMSLFRATCGMSILDYLIQHRLFHARRILATTDLKIIEVALESGFRSLSRFNEAFAKANACSPREYRQRLQCSLPGGN